MLITEKKAIRKIAEIIRTEKVDVVHTNVGPIVCGYEASKKMGIPHVWHIREYGDKDFNIKMFPSKFVFRKKLKNSYVISITHGLINYNKLDNCPNAQVIYNGVRKSNDVKLAGKREDFFLCASRVSPAKGFEQIIRVFSVFHEKYPLYKLRIIGLYDKEYVSKLVKLAKDGNSDDAIFFEGYKDNVSDYMAKAMALLVASPCEGFGRMTAEASFAGCIVVGKNTAGTKEIMDITGGFPFISDEEMLNAMISVCNLTEQEYCERAVIAQRRAISNFLEESYIDKVHSLYKSIVLTS
jgi:glycosyltransferase involved in cell wall biosynthesis